MDNHTTNATSTTSDNDNLTSEATTEDKIIGLQSCFLMYCQLLSSMESVKIYGLNRQELIEGGLILNYNFVRGVTVKVFIKKEEKENNSWEEN